MNRLIAGVFQGIQRQSLISPYCTRVSIVDISESYSHAGHAMQVMETSRDGKCYPQFFLP